ncbi:MAG: hypothetical protein L6V93_21735 [Clostridiales bacterium]|nr:MAG: hypothetical protein L6V93_21735 [Clostridiales bacterium]
MCVPIVGIVYDPKVKSFLDYVGQTHFIDAEKISGENFIGIISDCLKNKDAIREEFKKTHRRSLQKGEIQRGHRDETS